MKQVNFFKKNFNITHNLSSFLQLGYQYLKNINLRYQSFIFFSILTIG